ncbi:RIO1 family regulatory kinase/ATPase [Deinococcus radiophilus]|uniref:non-specific serine/threonine protein kinase n=1 Tax=Deinococcus radiophilus TaxID=32062 RepID=A0A431VR38_9DEIO|nr:RIO1 family regulatory kinase/ATPase [Deinococcus radiophilus]RTR25593.1 serine protein kinase RIO [Deinococcus radiophilus]UFA51691.1 phosphotransferase [Deinococcus radiophilus]
MSPRFSLEGWDDGDQRLRRKKIRPQARRKLSDLTADESGEVADDVIRRLLNLGHISELVSELKSGKEATTYLARSEKGSVLVKIYRDLSARSFKNDGIYRAGQVITDQRAARAMANRTRKGLEMLQFDWVMAEYAHLWQLWQAGLSVPEPLVGPNVKTYAGTVPAVLMRLIGTEDEPAPRLSEVRLTSCEAQQAWQQAVQGMADMLRLGYVHGDYSTYNLLWWQGSVVIIDFPQLSTRQNPNFDLLLRRDAQSLSSSFRRHGVQWTGEQTLREVRRRAQGAGPEPRLCLP